MMINNKKLILFNGNFPTSLFAQLNIEFPLKVTANFLLLRQFWEVKSLSQREYQLNFTNECWIN